MGNDDYNDYDDYDESRDDRPPDNLDSQRDSGRDGHAGAEPDHYSDGFLRPALADVDETAASDDPAGRWVTRGGVVAWQAPDDADESEDAPLLDDARSAWANEQIALPLGAPASARVRAVRAWLGLRRIRETELMGALLLERRRLAGSVSEDDSEDAEGVGRQSSAPEPPENPHDPLALALAEAQAAADEYETLLGLLEETRAHVGVQSALVEFYLAVGDRLAALAAHPLAPEDFAEQTLYAHVERQPASGEFSPAARSEWEGRAGAVLATRKRVEQVTAAEPEDD